jgi:hypothetical protein
MRSLVVAASFAVVLSSTAVRSTAHEGHDHGERVMGTVSAVHVDKQQVEVKDKDGKVRGFSVTDKTRYLRGKTAAALSDVKVGARVVVAVDGDGQTATEIRLASGTKEKAAADDAANRERN